MVQKVREPYEDTKVSYLKTQGELAELLDKHGRFTTMYKAVGPGYSEQLSTGRQYAPPLTPWEDATLRLPPPN